MGNEVGIGVLDIPGHTLGKNKCFGVINGKVAPGFMTCFRISTEDSYGVIKAYLGEEAVNKYLPWELKRF